MPQTTFIPLGDAALNVHTALARELLDSLKDRPVLGVLEAIPALNLLTVLFHPLQITPGQLQLILAARLSQLHPRQQDEGRTLIVPVVFDGPDLKWCVEYTGLSEADLIAAICAAPLEVAFLGFTPGFAFLTGLPKRLQMPRLPAPRERLPAGSVALGGPWAGVYPRETPGGWRIVGRTSTQFFDLSRPEPVLWKAGDRVHFEVAP